MMISRRGLMATAPVALLVGCSSLTTSTISADIDMIAKGVESILPLIKDITGVGQATYDKIVAVVAEIVGLASTNTTATGTTVFSNIGASIKKIIALLAGATLPTWVSTVLAAAEALIASYLPSTARLAEAMMTPDQARGILKVAIVR